MRSQKQVFSLNKNGDPKKVAAITAEDVLSFSLSCNHQACQTQPY
jgi:hypothetical protein